MYFSRLLLLAHTLRHLRPIQLYWRLHIKVANRCANQPLPKQVTNRRLYLTEPARRRASYEKGAFCFLNHRVLVDGAIPWNRCDLPKLWLYNLHYFDYLQQSFLERETGIELISAWIKDNPPCDDNGWEPYPLSLRLVNWIHFFARDAEELGHDTLRPLLDSLYRQARVLRGRLEFQLLGNHLFKNGVALLYAGRFFSGDEAGEWYCKGRRILLDQLDEQVLQDGGHFERSPMYHVLIIEDVLDCINLLRADVGFEDEKLEQKLVAVVERMLAFLRDILHPDGTLPIFNDTAQGIAPAADQLFAYASRLGLSVVANDAALVEKPQFGLYRMRMGDWHCIVDAGAIGPDYLPGHAHCDTLSYELALAGRPIVVNAGVYQYAGNERNDYRATRAHNTIEIDGAEQHEIWSTFRVARRGYPRAVTLSQKGDELCFSGQHTGYRRLSGKPVHQRDIRLTGEVMEVVDRVMGRGCHTARSFIHLHPAVDVLSTDGDCIACLFYNERFRIVVRPGCEWRMETYQYSPEFGLKQPTKMVVLEERGEDDFTMGYEIVRGG